MAQFSVGGNSLHLYEDQFPSASAYLGEAWQATVAMPDMPSTDPWLSIDTVRGIECVLREGGVADIESCGLDHYWKDISRLLAAYRAARDEDIEGLRSIHSSLHSATYKVFIEGRIDRLQASQASAANSDGTKA